MNRILESPRQLRKNELFHPRPVKHVRYTQPIRAMTLCIPAHADGLLGPKIVICSDTKIIDPSWSSNMAHKVDDHFAHGLVAMWSGTLDHVEDALEVYRTRLGRAALTLVDFKEELSVGFCQFEASLKRRGVKGRTDVQLIVAG